MPSELILRLTGGVNNTDPEKSLGGETSAWPVDLVNLFPTVERAGGLAGEVTYRALDLVNIGDQGAHRIKVWLAPGECMELGLSGTQDVDAVALGRPWDHGHEVSFGRYRKASPLVVPDIQCGEKKRLWMKRTTPPRSATGADSETLRISYL